VGTQTVNKPHQTLQNRTDFHKNKRDPAGLSVRRLVIETIAHVLKSRQGLDEAFELLLPPSGLEGRDIGLAKAIAQTSFRYKGSLEALIEQCCDDGLPAKSGSLRHILITAAAQILHMDVADHAAVDLAVTLTREDNRSAPYHALVNAVLRRIAREKDAILSENQTIGEDTPEWLLKRWIKAYGQEVAHALAQAHHQLPSLDMTIKDSPDIWAKRLNGVVLPNGSIRLLSRDTPIPDLEGFHEGAWWVQDVGASFAAQLLKPQAGERILDLCAAPGGKTAQLAAAGALVTALDRSEKRLKRLSENMARLNLNVTVVVADGMTYSAEPFDAVLLDAPCSATGTLRRHPEVAWVRIKEDILKLAQTQSRLLDQAAKLVKLGGRLVYCTCSLEPEEGIDQINAFLNRNKDFRREIITKNELFGFEHAITEQGDVRTLPCLSLADQESEKSSTFNGMDGFFIARLKRIM
jgi:16S rRNA (cytosine967-C5)-methyltransferase